ncbi:MAG: putative RHS-repeat protein [Steroidobacteraceae bacterium]|nr:putative RHS-repeat protein [Steroidobacteraceae bacterium]
MRTRDRMPVELRRVLEELFGDSVDDVVLRERSLFAWLHGRARATTRRNAIYLRGSLEDFFADPELMLHEYFHVLRQWNRGRMNLRDYLAEWWRHGYWENRYERQARRFVRLRLAAFRRALAGSAAGFAPTRRFNLLDRST